MRENCHDEPDTPLAWVPVLDARERREHLVPSMAELGATFRPAPAEPPLTATEATRLRLVALGEAGKKAAAKFRLVAIEFEQALEACAIAFSALRCPWPLPVFHVQRHCGARHVSTAPSRNRRKW